MRSIRIIYITEIILFDQWRTNETLNGHDSKAIC